MPQPSVPQPRPATPVMGSGRKKRALIRREFTLKCRMEVIKALMRVPVTDIKLLLNRKRFYYIIILQATSVYPSEATEGPSGWCSRPSVLALEAFQERGGDDGSHVLHPANTFPIWRNRPRVSVTVQRAKRWMLLTPGAHATPPHPCQNW